MSDPSASPIAPKDMEGVTDAPAAPAPASDAKAASASGSSGKQVQTRQKKIAVLTSGGDSAGMNAAGASSLLLLAGLVQSGHGRPGTLCAELTS